MIILLQKPSILYDNNNNLKSISHFKEKIKQGPTDINDLVCLPTVLGLCAIISFYIAKYIINNTID